jgi:hypothetical protein
MASQRGSLVTSVLWRRLGAVVVVVAAASWQQRSGGSGSAAVAAVAAAQQPECGSFVVGLAVAVAAVAVLQRWLGAVIGSSSLAAMRQRQR